MRHLIVISLVLLLVACVSSETVVTENNRIIKRGNQFNPESAAKIRVKLGLAYLQKNNMLKAKKNLEKALSYQPNDANIFRALAYYYQRVQEVDKALRFYMKSLAIDPNNPSTLSVYGVFLCEQGHYNKAEDSFLLAIKQPGYTGVSNTYENAGHCSERSGNINKAIGYYQNALYHNPNNIHLYLTLARLQIGNNEYEIARANLAKLSNENSAEILWQWIRLYNATNKGAALDKYGRKLLTQFPDSNEALNYVNHDYE